MKLIQEAIAGHQVVKAFGAEEYEVECITAQRGAAARRELLVRWKGYGAEHDEWRPRSELVRTAAKLVEQYDARQLSRGAALHQLALARAQLQALIAA